MSSISAALFALCSSSKSEMDPRGHPCSDEVEEAERRRREILARGFVLLIARAAVTRRCMHGEEKGGGYRGKIGAVCGEVRRGRGG
jgi:hypothetical protein